MTAAAPSRTWAALARGGWLRAVPPATLALFLVPVAAGLAWTFLPAAGYLPVLGADGLSLDPMRTLLAAPALGQSVLLSLGTGLGATTVATVLALALVAVASGTAGFARLQRLWAPVLAVPHAGLAIALAFLLAPSGWLLRLVSPWLTGWEWPPLLTTTNDPYGLSLALVLVVKETPFLLVVTLAAAAQRRSDSVLQVARSLGYGPVRAWFKAVLPQIYPLIRLPIYAVLAFAVSVVDVTRIIGPSAPAPLASRVLTWFNDPDLEQRLQGAAGAVLQLLVAVAAIALWALAVRLLARGLRGWLSQGDRGAARGHAGRRIVLGLGGTVAGLAYGGLAAMVLWSLAERWPWPMAWPQGLGLQNWLGRAAELLGPTATTLAAAAGSAAIALVLVVLCLENEQRNGVRASGRALHLLYLPLLVPQIAFLFGFQVLLLQLGLDRSWPGLIWSHLLFVLPYAYIVLAEPFRRFDRRYERTALCLGRHPDTVLLRIKLPMLLRPLLLAFAVGVAVSVTQYLPTLFAGGGRLATLTTEAVSLAGGGDRRLIALYAVAQAALPLIAFALALAGPGWLYRRRAGMLAQPA